jgi:hypothetical protein
MAQRTAEPHAKEPIHVHICTSCGNVSRRDDPDGVPDLTGVFRCSQCGHEGPLNIQIIDSDDPRLSH